SATHRGGWTKLWLRRGAYDSRGSSGVVSVGTGSASPADSADRQRRISQGRRPPALLDSFHRAARGTAPSTTASRVVSTLLRGGVTSGGREDRLVSGACPPLRFPHGRHRFLQHFLSVGRVVELLSLRPVSWQDLGA